MPLSLADVMQGSLLKAVKAKDITKVNELLAKGISESEGVFALVEAAQHGNLEIIQILIDLGVDVNQERPFLQGTALRQAAWAGHSRVVQVLLEAGANVNLLPQNPKEPTALILATQEGHLNVVKILVEAGANVNEVRPYGDYALLAAAVNGYEDIFNYLAPLTNFELQQAALDNLPQGIRRHWRQEQANPLINNLTDAIRSDNMNAVKTMLGVGLEVSEFDEYGTTALFWATQKQSIGLVQLLLEAGANPDRGLEEEGTTPLMIVAGARWTQKSTVILSLLLEADANVNARDSEYGLNVLMHLVKFPAYSEAEKAVRREAIEFLLRYGADINATNNLGKNVLDLVKDTGDLELVQLIEDASQQSRKT